MPFSLKLTRSAHPLIEVSATSLGSNNASLDNLDEHVRAVKVSWNDILSADEVTESGRRIKGSELFCLVFTERFQSLNCGPVAEQMLKQAAYKFGVNHAMTVIRFILSMEGRKKACVVRKLKSVGKDHLRRHISAEVIDMFLNAVLLAVGDRLGNKTNINGIIISWASLLLAISAGMRAASDEYDNDDSSYSSRVSSRRCTDREYSRSMKRSEKSPVSAGAGTGASTGRFSPTNQFSPIGAAKCSPWCDDEFSSVEEQETVIPLVRTATDGTEVLPLMECNAADDYIVEIVEDARFTPTSVCPSRSQSGTGSSKNITGTMLALVSAALTQSQS
jgi:hypothetical protein